MRHEFLVQVLGPFLAGIPILMAGAKVLLVANGNDATLGALLSTLNIPAVLLSVYLSVIPLLLVVLPGAFLVYKYGLSDDPRTAEGRLRTGLALLPLVGISFLLTPANTRDILSQLGIAGVFCVIAFSRFLPSVAQVRFPRVWQLNRLKSWLVQHVNAVAVAYAMYAVVAFPLTGDPLRGIWLPAVRIEIEGHTVGTGWVLEENEQTTQLLWPDSTVARFPSSQIQRIEFCNLRRSTGVPGNRPLVLLLSARDPGRQPACP
ncbi:hypothetical protein AB0B94_12640 [Micromonospora sp. NPDC048986]|uniref:hypothetical protein n=1 Tax=Micromonospora sp. NPDC048986 TaxID=3155644 RepID=UPI003401A7D8